MNQNDQLVEKLKSILHHKLSKQEYAKKLGISETKVYELFNIIKQNKKTPISTRKVDNEKGIIETTIITDFEPKNDIELAFLHKIDLDKYIIKNYWSKLLPTSKFTSSVFAKLKTPEDFNPEDLLKLLSDYKTNYIPVTEHKFNDYPTVNVELSLSDYHLAKRHIDIRDNTPTKRAQRYYDAALDLMNKANNCYNINTVVFPISNDFFHTDNYQNTTTNGTPQDVIVDFAAEYELGFDILVSTIRMLTTFANKVKVVLIQGNHDRTKSYYLAHGLEVFFKSDPNISFDRTHDVVKGVTLGNTFIGYHHGNCKIDDLPLLFATNPTFSKDFGISKFREVHTGDKHHYMAKEIKGVRIQQMPSLSGTDRWHLDNNFVHSVRAALILVYDDKLGKVAEFEYRI